VSRRTGREKTCSDATAYARMRQAEAFAVLARLYPNSDNGPARSAAVSNAVLAAIAAADAICCKRLGRHSSDTNHDHVLVLLRHCGKVGEDAATTLQALLALKNKAQYQDSDPAIGETKRALRSMEKVLRLAATA
jgi:uncharacterized membrane protein YccC